VSPSASAETTGDDAWKHLYRIVVPARTAVECTIVICDKPWSKLLISLGASLMEHPVELVKKPDKISIGDVPTCFLYAVIINESPAVTDELVLSVNIM
jgi:hypothetical protein